MKQLFFISLFCITLLANSLQEVPLSFSSTEREALLKELHDSSSVLVYTSKAYSLKKGWNKLTTPRDGVNVVQTFGDISAIKFVATYDDVNKSWAIFSPEKISQDKEMLFLKYLEPKVTFFVLAFSDVKVDIKSNFVNSTCQIFMKDKKYDFLVDTGMNKEYAVSKDETISLKSRYFSHYDFGIYNDTRVVLIYPKVKAKTKRSYRYGPALPKTALEFTKEYEAQKFYMYDFKEKNCYEGIFPSMQIPPFPTLRVVKESKANNR